jgi:hypothetical protein
VKKHEGGSAPRLFFFSGGAGVAEEVSPVGVFPLSPAAPPR